MSKRKTYTNVDLEAAISCVKRSKLSINKVAEDYGIPRKTLSDHINGKFSIEDNKRPHLLNKDEEDALVNYITYLSEQGFPMTRSIVRTYVKSIYKTNERTPPFNVDNGPSDKWFRSLLQRHPQLKEKTPETQDRARSRMANSNVMDQYFSMLKKEVQRLGLQGHPERIFNCDETGWNGKETSKTKVFGVKGRHAYQQAMSSSGHITANMCISADGRVLPTFLIYYKCLPHTSYKDGVPGNWLYGTSESGYMDSELFVLWFKEIFIPHCGSKRPVLLVMDNHDTHCSLEVLKLAKDNDVTLLGFPPHTTHILQPLDVSIMGPLKRKFTDIANNIGFVNKYQTLNKARFPVVLSYAIDQSMTMARVKGAFKKAGLYPVDRYAIDETQLVKSHLKPADPQPSTSSGSSEGAVALVTPSSGSAKENTSCPTCGTYLGGNPLVKEGLIPQYLADIFSPMPCKPQQTTRRKLVLESRVLTSDDHIKKIQEKKDEDEKRKMEIEKRKRKREERKEAKCVQKTSKKGKASVRVTPDPPRPLVVVDLDVCKMCKCVEPESGEDDVAWIECDTCECWYHVVCVGMDVTDVGETYFVCEDCCSV